MTKEIWFLTGSQDLYGTESLSQAEKNSRLIVAAFAQKNLPIKIVFKSLVLSADSIYRNILAVNATDSCLGIICWMHTFSPAKMWVKGLKILQKPLLHLNTQLNKELPYAEIDMDYMNLHQAAHGDKEFGHLTARLDTPRKIVVGHWQSPQVIAAIKDWSLACLGWYESQNLKIIRFGDNMRDVAVTEGDKLAAQIELGWSVEAHALGSLAQAIAGLSDSALDTRIEEYREAYNLVLKTNDADFFMQQLRYQARIELALEDFLTSRGAKAFTTNFQDLFGLEQLPGLACQNLMAMGYGFAGEGDWKTAAMLRLCKVMGLKGQSSFMEDYTYDLSTDEGLVLGAHMLEICPSISAQRANIEVHPLAIGGKSAPARLVFDAQSGPALNIVLVDMGPEFKLISSSVEALPIEKDFPKLPVARVLWRSNPNFKTAVSEWVRQGGGHHKVLSYDVSPTVLEDFCTIAKLKSITIN